MTSDHQITPDHLRRRAVAYLRQSSEGQVKHHVESQHRQYALADRARGLGFRDVDMLDVDLGASGVVAAKRWTRFERVLGCGAARSPWWRSCSVPRRSHRDHTDGDGADRGRARRGVRRGGQR